MGKTLIYFCKTAFFTMQNSVLLRTGSSACLSVWCESDLLLVAVAVKSEFV